MNAHRMLPPASLCLSPASRQPCPTQALHIHEAGDPSRGEVERYIAQRYRQRYGATLRTWFPVLVSLQVEGCIVAAAGYRDGAEPLFLERYLDAPIERCLRDAVPRERIVEAGQFAAIRPGAGRLLVPLMARHLHARGYAWAVSTLTLELHHLFTRIGLTPDTLATADAQRLSAAERADWGSYYEHAPQVCASRLADIVRQLQRPDR